MSTKLLMDVEEYLHTSFDGANCEYLDGEIVERNMGEIPHSDVQATLVQLFRKLRRTLGIRVVPEIRIQINARRYRVADVAVWRNDEIGTSIPTVPPFLAIEILSPEDRPEDSMIRMLPKIQEYLSIGVEYVWVIDPLERAAICFSKQNPGGSVCDVLRTGNPAIEIPIVSAFDLDA